MSIDRINSDTLRAVMRQSGLLEVVDQLANLVEDTDIQDDLRLIAVKLRAKERRDALGRDVLE